MKLNIFVLLNLILFAQAMNIKNIQTVKAFLENYQDAKNISCIIYFLDTFIDLNLDQNEKFQFMHGPFYKNLGSTCNIFICTSNYLDQSRDIDQEMKNHLWIIDGDYSQSALKWPVLEVTEKVTKLFCPGDLDSKLVSKKIPLPVCTEYPKFNGKPMKVSVVGARPNVFKHSDGQSITGFAPDSIDMLGEYIDYKPKYVLGARTWDETVLEVNNGSAHMGVKTVITKDRFDMVDFPAYIDFTEVIYIVPVPKPVDILYQLVQPFSVNVWLAWLTTLFAFCILFYLVTKLYLCLPGKNDALKGLKGVDFLLYPFGMLFEPLLNDIRWIRFLWEKTASGKMVTIGNVQLSL